MRKLLYIKVILIFFIIPNIVKANGEWFNTDKPNCKIWNPSPQPEETVIWSGECLNGKAHGKGSEVWRYKENGKWVLRLLELELVNGKSIGEVKITYENGDIYIGALDTNGERSGYGIYTLVNGEVYEGIWKDGEFQYAQKQSSGSSNSSSKLNKYKDFCEEIGFTPGTEKFGECVLKAMEVE